MSLSNHKLLNTELIMTEAIENLGQAESCFWLTQPIRSLRSIVILSCTIFQRAVTLKVSE